jgi:hypothetical protein
MFSLRISMHQQTIDRRNVSRPSPIAGVMALAAAFVIGMTVAAPVAAQVIVNGDFETTPLGGSFPFVYINGYVDPGGPPGPPGPKAWKVTLGSVNAGTGPAGTPCTTVGGHCVDLNGDKPGRIEQEIMGTQRGQTCKVSFMMSRHTGLATARLKTFTDGGTPGGTPTTPAIFTHSIAGVSSGDGKWEQKSFSFIASGLTTKLSFETLEPGAAGPQVDDVKMQCDHNIPPTPTPTPGTHTVVIDPCCPPWNKDLLTSMMFYVGQGSISQPYTLQFTPTPAFKSMMQAYINYLNGNPAITAITIDWNLHNQGTGVTPILSPGPLVLSTPLLRPTTWNPNGGGNYSPLGLFFTGFPLQVTNPGTWYMVHTVIHLNPGQKFFDEKCAINDIFVRIQAMGALRGSRPVLEFSDGQKVIKTVPIQ